MTSIIQKNTVETYTATALRQKYKTNRHHKSKLYSEETEEKSNIRIKRYAIVPTNTLIKPEYYCRQTQKGFDELTKKSLLKDGLFEPLIVNDHEGRENVIIDGVGRWEEALHNGFDNVPVIYVDVPAEDEKRVHALTNTQYHKFLKEFLLSVEGYEFINELNQGSENNQLELEPPTPVDDEPDIEKDITKMTYATTRKRSKRLAELKKEYGLKTKAAVLDFLIDKTYNDENNNA